MVERWIPATPEELTTALADGRLDEGPYLDLKQELGEGKRANLELAKDLSMFANDGGCLIYGVAEPQKGRFVPAPIQLAGLRERVEQVAAQRCDPPLRVDVRHIFAEEEVGLGFLVVRIPASPEAPHMVEGKYHGRMGTTRSSLSNAQVREIIASREAALEPVLQLLDDDIDRDPVPAKIRNNGHIYLVARPRFAPRDLVLRDVERLGGNWSTWIHKSILGGPFEPPARSQFAPDPVGGHEISMRGDGAALHHFEIVGGQLATELMDDPSRFKQEEARLVDLEVNEDGTLHLFSGRGTDEINFEKVILPGVIAGLTLRLIQCASRVSESTGFVGTWDLAVRLDGLRGARIFKDHFSSGHPYSSETYQHASQADTAELANDPLACVDRLVGRLLRGIGHVGGPRSIFPNL